MSTRSATVTRDAQLDLVFSALADTTRRRILARLVEGMRRERDDWYHRCHLAPAPLEGAVAFLATYRPFWEDTLAALAHDVEAPNRKKGRKR